MTAFKVELGEMTTPNQRVRVYPSHDSTVLIVGVTLAGEWVAEYRCLAVDFDERCVLAMERRVRAKERTHLAISR